MLATPNLKVPDAEKMETSQPVPDLWLEAKTATEVFSRFYS